RELLEQADALMRRNRLLEPDAQIPELTEIVDSDDGHLDDDSIADFGGEDYVPEEIPEWTDVDPADHDGIAIPDAFPILTDVVADGVPPPPAAASAGGPSTNAQAPLQDVAQHDEIASIPLPGGWESMPLPPIPGVASRDAVAPFAAAERGPDDARWVRLA